MSKNDITGDKLISRPTQGYQDGYDLIWGKTNLFEEDLEERKKPRESYCILYSRDDDDEKVTND